MPRHTTGEHHFYVPHAERAPRFLTPEPCWVIDSYRVKRWYYRAAPAVGDRVMWLQDGLETRVQSVKFSAIFFADGTAMRRPDVGRRLVAWVLPRLQNLIPATASRTASSTRRRPSSLRPDATTILV